MRRTIRALAAATALIGVAAQATIVLDEERIARVEEGRIIQSPIAGIENRFWFDYRINVTETREELVSDLNRASDIEDRRDAWEEYATELRSERRHYAREMAERGYRTVQVFVED